MEDNKIRIGLTQGDANGIGFELIFRTFMEPEMLELCTPVIYGSPKIASYHGKALGFHCPYTIINKVEDIHDDKVNLLVCFDEDVKVEFGKRTGITAQPAMNAIAAAVKDCNNGFTDMVVCGPVNRRSVTTEDNTQVDLGEYASYIADKYIVSTLSPGDAKHGNTRMRLIQNETMRAAIVGTGSISSVSEALTAENVTTKLRSLNHTLKRDYRIDNPRIAVLGICLADEGEENNMLSGVISSLTEEDIQAFGPYRSDDFFARGYYNTFDAILAMYPEQVLTPLKMITDTASVIVETGLPIVCTAPMCNARTPIAGRGLADAELLRKAIYAGTDILAARKDYDEARANPLKKLYKEHSDAGERPYFPIPKRAEHNDEQQ